MRLRPESEKCYGCRMSSTRTPDDDWLTASRTAREAFARQAATGRWVALYGERLAATARTWRTLAAGPLAGRAGLDVALRVQAEIDRALKPYRHLQDQINRSAGAISAHLLEAFKLWRNVLELHLQQLSGKAEG